MRKGLCPDCGHEFFWKTQPKVIAAFGSYYIDPRDRSKWTVLAKDRKRFRCGECIPKDGGRKNV